MHRTLGTGLCCAGLLLLWGSAAWLWPGLPDEIPVHFDGSGAPDRWADRSLGTWLLLPLVGTLVALLFGLALPAFMASLAASNSVWLNVPRRDDFGRLPPAARVRALAPLVTLLRVLAAEVALLFTALLLASSAIARGRASVLPPPLLWTGLVVLVVTVILGLWIGNRGVRRALAQLGAQPAHGKVSDGSAEGG